MKNLNIETLASWVANLKEEAMKDTDMLVSWYPETKELPFSIVGGWENWGFTDSYKDLLCLSKKSPEYCMSIKIIKNDGPYAYADFESLNMPVSIDGEVDDTCIALEWEDCPMKTAEFFKSQWERIIDEYLEKVA